MAIKNISNLEIVKEFGKNDKILVNQKFKSQS